MQTFSEEFLAQNDARNAIFEQLVANFSIRNCKVAAVKEINEQGLTGQSGITYGELEYKSFALVFKWI